MANQNKLYPELDIDNQLRELGYKVDSPAAVTERNIVWRMCEHLAKEGWMITELHDEEEKLKVVSAKEAMELIFNLDIAYPVFNKEGSKQDHWVMLVVGNTEDIISDYSIGRNDQDGFGAVMEAFCNSLNAEVD